MGVNMARTTLECDARAVTLAGQEVARQPALLDQARIQRAKDTLRAPLTADPGQSVGAASVLMAVTDLGRLVVKTDVSYAVQIKPGQVATLHLSGATEGRAGKGVFVSQQVDTATGGLAVTIAPIRLMVTVNNTVDDRATALTIPRSALSGDAEMVATGGQAQSRDVTATRFWSLASPQAFSSSCRR